MQIVVRVLLIVLVSLFFGWLAFDLKKYIFSILPFILLIFLTFNLVSFLNRTNRQMNYFFESVRNEDYSLSFPKKLQNNVLDDLHKNLVKVNHFIQKIQIENKQQEQYFQALLEHVATGIITFDMNSFVVHSNSSVRNLLSLNVLTHLSQLEKVDSKLAATIKNIQPSEQKLVQISNENKNIQLLLKANWFKYGQKELMIVSVQDIKNELDQKELESWRKLIRVLMHKIMNSVTPVTSLSESLAGYFYKDGKIKSPKDIDEKIIETTLKGLEVIKEQGKGLSSFVESYRKLTRLPKPDKKAFPIKNLVENILILSGSFEHADNIKLIHEIDSEEMEILADENQISQVLINLVKNAYQANAGNPDARVKISVQLDENGRPQILVTDNGPGISEELMDKIFIPFFTTKENGSGIGLSVSRQIMQLHGGSLKIVSIPGKITSAVLTF